MLKPSQLTEEIKTNYAIDMILYDSELAKEVEQLKASVTTIEDDCKLQSIGSLFSVSCSSSLLLLLDIY